ncbi:M14 family metallopeptidase [Mangrovimonas cancribranchiae]|uniref:M14 family metallopeptidase n=1 Tax=Mangrovimonas cancribranchiae TaxID=3080055 RepID=A0AAU6P023_9FLAO
MELVLNLPLYKDESLSGRYIHNQYILDAITNYKAVFKVKEIGKSVLGEPINALILGHGSKRIFMWSQMHGNESTTTKAVFDLLNLFNSSSNAIASQILDTCTIAIIPILNPDGAKQYTRVNANDVDLNRDAKNLSQPESKVLRDFFNDFKPDFCFNLHGQRTIFSAGKANKSATVSFLAPSEDEERTITTTRKKAMEVIVAMNNDLQKIIPGQVGIYDDTFNINCVGDMFQSLGCPTVLFEAGHYANDYKREKTRVLIFRALVTAIKHISENDVSGTDFKDYFNIPNNEKLFYDIIIRNAKLDKADSEKNDVAIQYQEKLESGNINFVPKIEKISNLNGFYGHLEYNANNNVVLTQDNEPIKVGFENDFVMVNNEKYSLKLTKS